MRLVLAQTNLLVGDIAGNLKLLEECLVSAREELRADLVIFPELCLTGYPAEDLLLRPAFLDAAERALAALVPATRGIAAVVSHPLRADGQLFNAASLLVDGRLAGTYRKQLLPNYRVFDEKRYFVPGDEPLVADFMGTRLGLVICEDMWGPGPVGRARDAGAEWIAAPNASPYHMQQREERNTVLQARHLEAGLPMVYVNLLGGQDDLVFDGRSCIVDADGQFALRAPAFEAGLFLVNADIAGGRFEPVGWRGRGGEHDPMADLHAALVMGLRDYVRKNCFEHVLLGLSGGIDSALVAALAAEAVGPDNVRGIMMPTRYTRDISLEDARTLAGNLAIAYDTVPIEGAVEGITGPLSEAFGDPPSALTAQNIQARIRGVVLMGLSNQEGGLLLATGNKSELAVGYSTLYGDMCGGFSPLKDCYKTRVYQLAEFVNRRNQVIPERIITRPPSAELSPDQLDEHALPPYSILDSILERHIEGDQSVEAIIAEGFESATVHWVARRVLANEFKRRQAAPGTRVSNRSFGRDRRYPITSGWRE